MGSSRQTRNHGDDDDENDNDGGDGDGVFSEEGGDGDWKGKELRVDAAGSGEARPYARRGEVATRGRGEGIVLVL